MSNNRTCVTKGQKLKFSPLSGAFMLPVIKLHKKYSDYARGFHLYLKI